MDGCLHLLSEHPPLSVLIVQALPLIVRGARARLSQCRPAIEMLRRLVATSCLIHGTCRDLRPQHR